MATTRRFLLSAIFAITALGSAGGAFSADEVVKLGVLAPLTGGAAARTETTVAEFRAATRLGVASVL